MRAKKIETIVPIFLKKGKPVSKRDRSGPVRSPINPYRIDPGPVRSPISPFRNDPGPTRSPISPRYFFHTVLWWVQHRRGHPFSVTVHSRTDSEPLVRHESLDLQTPPHRLPYWPRKLCGPTRKKREKNVVFHDDKSWLWLWRYNSVYQRSTHTQNLIQWLSPVRWRFQKCIFKIIRDRQLYTDLSDPVVFIPVPVLTSGDHLWNTFVYYESIKEI